MNYIDIQNCSEEMLLDFVDNLTIRSSQNGIYKNLTTDTFLVDYDGEQEVVEVVADLSYCEQGHHISGEPVEFMVQMDGEWNDNSIHSGYLFTEDALRNHLLIWLLKEFK